MEGGAGIGLGKKESPRERVAGVGGLGEEGGALGGAVGEGEGGEEVGA